MVGLTVDPAWRWKWQGLLAHIVVGSAAGVILLHPATKAIYGAEWQGVAPELARLGRAFSPSMLPMTGAFAMVGGLLGLVFGLYHRLLGRQRRALGFLEAELERTLSSLIASGESETVEFKAAARWDLARGSVNREIGDAIARTIAGFLNNRGGSLLVGVRDDGSVCGIGADYRTLRDQNRDGFERFIIALVRERIGGDACPLVHSAFHRCGGEDVCRIIVEPAARPVYYHEGGASRLFVRAGNCTRELDVREAMEYVGTRFPAGPERERVWAGRLLRAR